MPYVRKMNADAQSKEGIYAVTEMRLRKCYSEMQSQVCMAREGMETITENIDSCSELEGDYYNTYMGKKRKYVSNYKVIMSSIENNLSNIENAISRAESNKNDWAAKVFSYVWEDEKDGDD